MTSIFEEIDFIGLSGAGKTLFSIILSFFIKKKLIDTDILYEKIYNIYIKKLILKKKEMFFRKTEFIVNNIRKENIYESKGGGSIKNLKILKKIINKNNNNSKKILITLISNTFKKKTYISKIYKEKTIKKERKREFNFLEIKKCITNF